MEQTAQQPTQPRAASYKTSWLTILRRRWWIIALLMVGALVVTLLGVLGTPPEYRSSLRLQVFVLDDEDVTLFSRPRTPEAFEQINLTQAEFADVLRSPLIAWRTINDLGLGYSASELLDHLQVDVSTEFMTVSFRADSPQEAQDVLSQHVSNSMEHFGALRSQPVKVKSQFVQSELNAQAQALTAAEDELLRFRLEHNVGDLDREINAVQDLLRQLEVSRNAAQVELRRAEALGQEWEQLANEASQRAQEAAEELDSLQSSAGVTAFEEANATAGATTGGQDRTIGGQIAALQEQITLQNTLVRDYRAAALEQQSLAAAQRAAVAEQEMLISQRRVDLTQLISLSSQYNSLVDAVTSAQADYEFLRGKAVEARLTERQIEDVGYLQVIEGAYLPDRPATSSTLRLILLAAAISLLVGVVLVLALEMISPTTASPATRPSAANTKLV